MLGVLSVSHGAALLRLCDERAAEAAEADSRALAAAFAAFASDGQPDAGGAPSAAAAAASAAAGPPSFYGCTRAAAAWESGRGLALLGLPGATHALDCATGVRVHAPAATAHAPGAPPPPAHGFDIAFADGKALVLAPAQPPVRVAGSAGEGKRANKNSAGAR